MAPIIDCSWVGAGPKLCSLCFRLTLWDGKKQHDQDTDGPEARVQTVENIPQVKAPEVHEFRV